MSDRVVRDALLAGLQQRFSGIIKTFYSGFPAFVQVESLPALAVYLQSRGALRGQFGAWLNYLRFAIELMVDARAEAESRNRGVSNENWLADRTEEVVSLLLQLNLLGGAIQDGDIAIDYRQPVEGVVRSAIVSVTYLRFANYEPVWQPDPVVALRNWVVATWPEAQTDPTNWAPTDDRPGIFWRLAQLTPAELTAAVSWLDAQLAAHILAPSPSVRLEWVWKLANTLTGKRRIPMGDGSPLYIMNVTANGEADPARQGQVRVAARFGTLQPAALFEILRRAVVGGSLTGEVT